MKGLFNVEELVQRVTHPFLGLVVDFTDQVAELTIRLDRIIELLEEIRHEQQ